MPGSSRTQRFNQYANARGVGVYRRENNYYTQRRLRNPIDPRRYTSATPTPPGGPGVTERSDTDELFMLTQYDRVQDSVQQEPLFVDSINVPSKENTRFLLTELFFKDLRASERESSLRDPLFVLSTDTQETIATLQRVVVDYLFTLDADARAREYVAQDKPLLSVKQALDRTYNTIDKLLLPDLSPVLGADRSRLAIDYLFTDTAALIAQVKSRLLIDYLFADSLQTIESSGGAVEVDRDVVDTLLLDDAVLRDRAIDAIDLLFARDEQATDRQMSVLDKLFLLTVQETYRTRDRTIVDLLFTDETQAALTERIQSALDNLLIRDDAFRDRQLSLIDRFVIASLVSASSQGINLRDITDRLFLLENPITRETESTWTNALFSRSVDDRLSERNRADLDYLFTDTVLARLKETVRSATDSMYTDSLAAREREHTAGTDKLFIYSGTGRREAVLGFVEYVLSLEQQSFDNARQLTDKLFVLSVQDVLSAGIFLRDITDELFLRSTDERFIALEQINKALLLTTQTVEYVAQVINADDLFVDDARKFVLERALLDSMLLTSQLLGRTTELLQKFDLLLRDERTTEQERAFFETVLLNSIADTLLETAAQVRTVTDYLLVLSAEARASDKQITSNLLLDSLSTALREVIVLREIVDRLLTFDDLQEQRELIADADNLFTSDTVDRVIQRFGNVVDAVDSLLMRDARTSDRSFVADFDSLFVNALRSSSVAHSFVNLLLVRDAADAFTGIERLVVDNVLFADSVLRGFEKLNLDGLNVTSISEVVKTGVVFRQALDAILLLDTASTQLPLIQSTDTLLLRDARLTELARLARSTLLTQSQRTSALEASQRDNVFVDQATADRIRTALAGTVDNVLLDETLTKLLDSSQVDHLFLEQTAAVAGKEIARELAEAVFLLDSRAQSGRDIYVADTVLLKAIATRIKELLYANNLFLDETSAAQWYPVVVEFITYARLGTSVVLGLVTDNEELIAGQRLSWQDLLGRVTGVGRWREQPTPLIFSAGGFASGFDSGFNV